MERRSGPLERFPSDPTHLFIRDDEMRAARKIQWHDHALAHAEEVLSPKPEIVVKVPRKNTQSFYVHPELSRRENALVALYLLDSEEAEIRELLSNDSLDIEVALAQIRGKLGIKRQGEKLDDQHEFLVSFFNPLLSDGVLEERVLGE